MVRQLAHEVRNPLAGLRGAAQLLERELHQEALKEYTTVIMSEADRLRDLVDTMLGPTGPPRKQALNVHEICEHVYQLLRSEAPGGVSIERDYDPSVPEGRFDRNELIQALLNIARKALQALNRCGRLVLRTGPMLPRALDSAESAGAAVGADAPDVRMTDVRMPGKWGIDLLQRVQASHAELPVIVMTGQAALGTAVSAYGSGAFEYLPKPFDIDHAVDLVRRAAQSRGGASADGAPADVPSMPSLLGRAPAMQQVFRAIGRLARSSVNVLITGESGTGKELVARALHEHSPRAGQTFIALNTSAIPTELLEAELFGHQKGSFTGADSLRRGRFEQADGGSLFLDEIGHMSPPRPTRLLRGPADVEFYRVGGHSPIRLDVRVIAATHQNLEERSRSGQFRVDLYHRLNVIRIELPPLRERRVDIPELLRHYLQVAARELGVEAKALTTEAGERLESYPWPGNVRELVNFCRRATALAPGKEIRVADLPAPIIRAAGP